MAGVTVAQVGRLLRHIQKNVTDAELDRLLAGSRRHQGKSVTVWRDRAAAAAAETGDV